MSLTARQPSDARVPASYVSVCVWVRVRVCVFARGGGGDHVLESGCSVTV